MQEAESFKAKGNLAVEKRDYQLALSYYSKAIALDPTNAACLSNRSFVYLHLNNVDDAIADAKKCVEIAPQWPKAHFRLGSALSAGGFFSAAVTSFSAALNLDGASKEVEAALSKALLLQYESYISPSLVDKPVSIRYIDSNRGRGVFASRGFSAHEVIFSEVPIASQRTLVESMQTGIQSCHHCMKTKLSKQVIGPFADLYDAIPQSTWVHCTHCAQDPLYAVQFCSRKCEDRAWSAYHQILCTGLQNGKPTAASSDHPLRPIFDLCRANGKINPPLILKMLAMVVQDMRRGTSFKDAWFRFGVFSASTESKERCYLDQEAIAALQEVLGPSDITSEVATIQNYRFLHGVIARNAQNLLPVSDLHLHLNSLPPDDQQTLVNKLDASLSPLEFSQSPFMNNLCISGTGLYAVANTMNHSCLPNVAVTCSTNSDEISVLALTRIKRGDELVISYIDEEGPFAQRKQQLHQFYSFECTCAKCLNEKRSSTY
eukprot:TRINITY_DN355_c0_g1_i10.p1 TRINITY_DN355_c0_g1~~TRINITY_DN355_c0_g1_i10.p1  ORF type:complete len:489 (-),score=48.55 TRINITY_DN355_c0_g1_i10:1216-2682(-)